MIVNIIFKDDIIFKYHGVKYFGCTDHVFKFLMIFEDDTIIVDASKIKEIEILKGD